MKDQLHIQYYKWSKNHAKNLFRSCELLDMKSIQFYLPLFSLYFYIHNTPNSVKRIDFKRKYYVHQIKEITKQRYYNSNMFLKTLLYDSGKNSIIEKEVFCKTIPILEAMHCLNNNYNLVYKNNYHLPSAYNYNTFRKINDIDNTAYIDVFCSYLFGELTHSKKLPSFPIFYGSINGIGNYKYDITEEYNELRIDKCFNKNLGKGFTMDMYISDTESESDEGSECSTINDDFIAHIKNIPIQLLFIEKLEGTLEDILNGSDYNDNILISCLFQISFALSYLQKYYSFTHNDLHINNIMFKETDKKFLYYKVNNIYYRIPTFGKLFKIIDFGRAILTFKKKVFMNDVFSNHSEAGGQYTYPNQVQFIEHKKQSESISPNYNFDLCRLSMTILDELPEEMIENKDLLSLLIKLCQDKNGASFRDMDDDFRLYISIAKDACHALPKNIIQNQIFKKYRVPKKQFPKKSFYSL